MTFFKVDCFLHEYDDAPSPAVISSQFVVSVDFSQRFADSGDWHPNTKARITTIGLTYFSAVSVQEVLDLMSAVEGTTSHATRGEI